MGRLERWVRLHLLRQRQHATVVRLLGLDGSELAAKPVEMIGWRTLRSTHEVEFDLPTATVVSVRWTGANGEDITFPIGGPE